MKQTEILGLVVMVYDYEPKFAEHNIESSNPLLLIVHEVFNFLQKKKYFDKEGRPTKKLYRLLDIYDVRIKQIEDSRNQENEKQENEETENQ